MAFDEQLAARVRAALRRRRGLSEKKMFGGVAFLINGHMGCGIIGGELIVRLQRAQAEAALAEPHVRAFAPSGRAMKGWVRIGAEGLADDDAVDRWARLGGAFAAALPPK